MENPDNNLYVINLIWDVSFSTNIEAILFQRTFITVLASLYYTFSNISCEITDDSIFINSPDESGPIIKPTTQITHSKLYPFSNHYKGQISLNLAFVFANTSEFLDAVESTFKNLLIEITTMSNSI